MKLSSLGEFGLIRKIRALSSSASPGALVGIGDDAAALSVSSSATLLAAADMLIEDVHFDLSYTDFYSLGWKSAAVNLSDIAAMGGAPRFSLTSLGIPPHITAEQIVDFYRGFSAALRVYGASLVGGDTCASPSGLTVSVTVLGEAAKRTIVTRAGAGPGDRIFVTGTLGDAAAGLEILRARVGSRKPGAGRRGFFSKPRTPDAELMARHLRPVPRVEWGMAIARSGCASAMIDVSDGLSSDLGHICEESGVGAAVASERIPLSPSLRKASAGLESAPLQYALSGGEDYELLFTVPPAKLRKLELLGMPVTEIGEITRRRSIVIADDGRNTRVLQATGHDHFTASRRRSSSST